MRERSKRARQGGGRTSDGDIRDEEEIRKSSFWSGINLFEDNSVILSIAVIFIISALFLSTIFILNLREDRDKFEKESIKQRDRISQLEGQVRSLGEEPIPEVSVSVPSQEPPNINVVVPTTRQERTTTSASPTSTSSSSTSTSTSTTTSTTTTTNPPPTCISLICL